MRLKSLTLTGFKSFPQRTRLDFGPGVSVVVGPNGSGKSNITDAVLWAMGEQSPLAVRGGSMQDVIFGGAPGVQARSSAEVEIVLENADGRVDLPLSEISIARRLDRSGEGSYRLNGARCRLIDVIEALSDTGLGKETHSVISQGRVEEIVTSKPRERRLLIEEAAGLGKHRKRRRRAQLKLERTQQNLDRALDIEREARTRLRPLKRQAEAAELHARLERQTLEAKLELAREQTRAADEELQAAEREAQDARAARGAIEQTRAATIERRGAAERALAERAARHDALARRVYASCASQERLELRREQAGAAAREVARRLRATAEELAAAKQHATAGESPRGAGEGAGDDRAQALTHELAEVEAELERELEAELAGLNDSAKRQQEQIGELDGRLARAREACAQARELVAKAREGSAWSATWQEVREALTTGVERAVREHDEQRRAAIAAEVATRAEEMARSVVEYALQGMRAAESAREQRERELLEVERLRAQAGEEQRRTQWLIEQRREAAEQGPLALRRAQLRGELAAEQRASEELARERDARKRRLGDLRDEHARCVSLAPLCERLGKALSDACEALGAHVQRLEAELTGDSAAGDEMTSELRACAAQEAELHAQLRAASETVTASEVSAQRVRDRLAEARLELTELAGALGLALPELTLEPLGGEQARAADQGGPDKSGRVAAAEPLGEEEVQALRARIERLSRRREQLGPVNPLAQEEYAQALEHVEELEARREDLESALRELRRVISETDREIQRSFQETFQAAADNFELLAGDLFPGGTGRLRLVREEPSQRMLLGGQRPAEDAEADGDAREPAEEEEELELSQEEELEGVEIEIAPAGKSAKRLSLLSGGEKSMTALAFLFAVFLAKPCPFYILDEVEAALDDLNLDRFLSLLRRYADRAQFIVITHQKRTMEAADWLYGVSMGADGVSKVLSRRLPPAGVQAVEVAEVA